MLTTGLVDQSARSRSGLHASIPIMPARARGEKIGGEGGSPQKGKKKGNGSRSPITLFAELLIRLQGTKDRGKWGRKGPAPATSSSPVLPKATTGKKKRGLCATLRFFLVSD